MYVEYSDFFHFDEIGEKTGADHWQNHNNSNGKLALKHIVPFLPESIESPFPDNDYDFQPVFD